MRILAIILIVGLVACKSKGISKDDKELIKLKLEFLRMDAATDYKVAAIKKETEFKIKYIDYSNRDSLVKLSVKAWSYDWNKPYDITKDSTITYEKYLDWCKANNFDPVTKIDFLK